MPVRRPPTLPRRRGFTLMELLIAMAVLAILGAAAIPTFLESIRKGRRSDAMTALNQIVQAQERWRANNATYFGGDVADLPGAPGARSANGHYTLSIVANSATATGYVIRATATGGQANDSACARFQVTLAGGTLTYGATTAADGDSPNCWVK